MSDAGAKRQWVITVLGLRFPDDGTDDEEPVTTQHLAGRLKAVQTLAGQGGDLAQIVAQLREVAQAVREQGVQADEDVEMLEQHVADIREMQSDKELAGEIHQLTRGSDEQDTKLTRIRAALAAARSDIELAAETLSEACAAQAVALKAAKEQQGILSGDEDEIITAAQAAGDEVPPFDETANMLEDLFEEYESAEDEAEQKQLLAEAGQAIAAYRAGLTDPLLTEMEETDAGSYQIMSAIEDALSELIKSMQS